MALSLVNVYNHIVDAEIAKSKLEANHIKVYLSGDDCGGMEPALQFTAGVRLLVDEKDMAVSKQILSFNC